MRQSRPVSAHSTYRDPVDGLPLHRVGDELRREDGGGGYPITGGIPRFVAQLDRGAQQIQRVFDYEHARYERSYHVRFSDDLVARFLEDCELPADFFEGRRVLDAGCGSGRWSYAMALLGADVWAMDLTASGVQSLAVATKHRSNVHICQGDLFRPPFAPASFDFVVSWGVLHHTRSTRDAFASVASLVRPGGTFYVMVYPPLPYLQGPGTDLLRMLMRRLSDERRYAACRRLVVHNPWLARVLNLFVMNAYLDRRADEDEVGAAQFGLFDAYSPRYNFRHSAGEVVRWFRDEGFREVVVVDSTGNIRVRGTRAQ